MPPVINRKKLGTMLKKHWLDTLVVVSIFMQLFIGCDDSNAFSLDVMTAMHKNGYE